MDLVVQTLWAALAAALTAVVPIGVRLAARYGEVLGERALAEVQRRLGDGAARVAGEIVAELRASPELQAATQSMLLQGAEKLGRRFPDTIRKHGVPAETLAGMIAGELGKLGVGVARR